MTTMEETEFISVIQFAKEIGIDRSHARKYILSLGLRPKKRRTAESRNQLTLTLTKEEARFAAQQRHKNGFQNSYEVVKFDAGVFYIIQLIPEFDPGRIKLGFASVVEERLSQHKTVAPTARLIKTWPCKRSWESTVMDCLSFAKCRLIRNEVFECDDLEMLINLGDKLFSILPDPDRKIEVAECSPLNQRMP